MSDLAENVLRFDVPPDDGNRSVAGLRLDRAIVTALQRGVAQSLEAVRGISRSQIARWIEEGCVSVNGQTVRRTTVVARAGDRITIRIPEPQRSHLEPDPAVVFTIVYQDEDLIVIDKPPGLVVHPGSGNRRGTLVHGVVHLLGDVMQGSEDSTSKSDRPGLVHRLDKDTSGLMVVAKTAAAQATLVAQFVPPRRIMRTYQAVVMHLPRSNRNGAKNEGEIGLPIGRSSRDRKRMTVRADGREARTRWRVLQELSHGYVLELALDTGRTHQIRVHLRAVGAPIVGDPVYGPPLQSIPARLRPAVKMLGRQALHASRLSFEHPKTGERMTFVSSLPGDIAELVRTFDDDS